MTNEKQRGDDRKVPIVRKLAVSVGIGAIAYLVTNILIDAIGERQIWVITLSLLIGSVVFLVQFTVTVELQMNDVERAEARHSRSVEHLVDERLSEIRQDRKSRVGWRKSTRSCRTDSARSMRRRNCSGSSRPRPYAPTR